ncbi:hypothetical protein KY362_01520, partial [Candidatus Woesearchaeota archaeon]|nr:hypothetical protein [Candidatus Woesearchaeota archaeon]
MRYLIPCIIAAILLFAAGCTGQVTPSPEPKPVPPTQTVNDFDSCVAAGNPVMESYPRQCRHGSRTYTEVIDTPIEPPDTPPEPLPDEPLVGADEDEHGCKGSAGYQWCEATQKCQRFWEEPCDSELRQKAQEFCTHEGVSYVGTCGDYIKVTSSLPGEGTKFYYTDGEELECPLVAPEYMTEDCRNTLSSECKDICTVTEDPKQLA